MVLQHTSGKENLAADTLSRNTDKVEADIPDVDAPEPGEVTRRIARATRQSEKIRRFTDYTPKDIPPIGEQDKNCQKYHLFSIFQKKGPKQPITCILT